MKSFPKPIKKVKVRKPMNRIKKTPLAKLKREADKLARELCLKRGKCESCGSLQWLQWAHLLSRRYHSVRWETQNCFCLCRECHAKFTYSPDLWMEWLIRFHEKRFLAMLDVMHVHQKVDREFMEITIEGLKLELLRFNEYESRSY